MEKILEKPYLDVFIWGPILIKWYLNTSGCDCVCLIPPVSIDSFRFPVFSKQ